MKKLIKLTAVLLSLALTLTLSVGVSANDVSSSPDDIDLQSSISLNEITDDSNILVLSENEDMSRSSSNITGNLEEVSASRIKGWAYQTGKPNTPIDVHVYIKHNTTGAQTAFALTANQYRADLQAAGYGNGYHAFNYAMDWSAYRSGTYTVSVYGINGSNNPHIPNSPRTFTVRKATGTVDGISNTGVSGWAWKPDSPNNSIQVHLYIRLSNNETVYSFATIANTYRGDLYNAGYGDGEHGYFIPIDWSSLPKERLRVTLYAVDGSGENPIIYDSYYNNALPHGAITLYGIGFANQPSRTTYYTNAVRTAISNIGVTVTNGIYTESTYQEAFFKMKTSMIWVVHTHGNNQTVLFNSSTQGNTSLTYNHISALHNDALRNERCVIYGTCSAGEGGENAENMVNITHQKGAMTVIGWEGLTAVSQMNTWLEEFLVSSGEGKRIGDANTIGTAIYEAIVAVRSKHNNNLGGLADIYCAGSTTQMLIS